MNPNPEFEKEVLAMLRPEINRPDIAEPDLNRPGVINPEITRPDVINPEVTRPEELTPPEEIIPKQPPFRGVLDSLTQLGTLGLGAAAAVPLAISKIEANPRIREVL